jgi:hypothetical protein
MDRYIVNYKIDKEDLDLSLCLKEGVAYQKNMDIVSFIYAEEYFEKYESYENTPMDHKLNLVRTSVVNRHHQGDMVDIGIGSGSFIKSRPRTDGFDINPVAVKWLMTKDKYFKGLTHYKAFSFWDVLEHVKEPQDYLAPLLKGSRVFISIPIFKNLEKIRESKHYRPNEHLYYFTHNGLISWMNRYGYGLLEYNDKETEAGREQIMTYVFYKFSDD